MTEEKKGAIPELPGVSGVPLPASPDRLSPDEVFAAILQASENAKAMRAKEMPTVQDAINRMTQAHHRLEELGWRSAIYCPKDGTPFEVIEAGSTGIHRCHYQGEWPKGSWWIEEAGDLWPSRPVLFRSLSDCEGYGTEQPVAEGDKSRDRVNPNHPGASDE